MKRLLIFFLLLWSAIAFGQILPGPQGLTSTQANGHYAESKLLNAGFFSTRPCKPGASTSVDTADTSGFWTRTAWYAPYAASKLYLGFANGLPNTGDTECQGTNSLLVMASVRKQGASVNRGPLDSFSPASFAGGKLLGTVFPDFSETLSDPISINIAAGEMFFAEDYVVPYLPTGPPQPTGVTQTTGFSLTLLGNYYFTIRYLYPDGTLSAMSTPLSGTLTSSNNAFVIPSPPASGGAIGYIGYITTGSSGNTSTTNMYAAPPYAFMPIGSPMTIGNVTVKSNGAPSAGGTTNGLYPQARPGYEGIPTMLGLRGGTTPGACNDGESMSLTNNMFVSTTVAGRNTTGGYYPNFILAVSADGKRHPSILTDTDSMDAPLAAGDVFSNAGGGAIYRAFNGQSLNQYEQLTETPLFGYYSIGQGGKTEEAACNWNSNGRGLQCLKYATDLYVELGFNDIFGGKGAINWYGWAKTYYGICAGLGVKFHQGTIAPSVLSSDNCFTLANESIPMASHTVQEEGERRQANNLIADLNTNAAVPGTVSNESPFRIDATITTSTNSYNGGNATATQWLAKVPFVQSGLVVTVDGVTKTSGTDYNFLVTGTIGATTYAEGVTFTSAPANGADIRFAYTKLPGLATWGQWWGGYIDEGGAGEVNGAGVPTPNGGFVSAPGVVITSGTMNSVASSTTFTDTTKTTGVTQDQFKCEMLRITSDTTKPSAAGQSQPIVSNTASSGGGTTFVTSAFPIAGDGAATYTIVDTMELDDFIHPAPPRHRLRAQAIAAASGQFFHDGLQALVPDELYRRMML